MLYEVITDWLMDHILLHDMAIKPYLLANLEAVSAAEGVDFATLMNDGRKRAIDWTKLSVLAVEDSRPFAHVLRAILEVIGIKTVSVVEERNNFV